MIVVGRATNNVSFMLPYQDHGSLFLHFIVQVINALGIPNKGGGFLGFTTESAIPASYVARGGVYHLAPAVVHPEHIDRFHANGDRAEQVVVAIAVRRKGIGYIETRT